MAIQTRIVNNSYTEIYVGGGNFITQSAPTNFHQFWTRRILVGGETVADFREVTATEKTALETSDAAWKRPDQGFIDEWNSAANLGQYDRYGQYNETTGFFELNGLTDITEDEARRILRYSHFELPQSFEGLFEVKGSFGDEARKELMRTYFPAIFMSYEGTFSVARMFRNQVNMVACPGIFGGYGISGGRIWGNADQMFDGCTNLRIITNSMKFHAKSNANAFRDCIALEDIRLEGLNRSISFSDSPSLNAASISYMIAQALINNSPFTITLHPTAYARVTEEIFAAATAKQITIASA